MSDPTRMVDMGFTRERFPVGTHMCYLYNAEDERREIVSQYVNAGLEAGEMVAYFADVDEDLDAYLESLGVIIPDGARENRMLVRRTRDIICPHGTFAPEQTLSRLRAACQACDTQGLPSLRVTGEMSWALAEDIEGRDRLIEFEARLNLLVETHPFTGMCQYDTNAFAPETIFDILRVHPLMVVKGQVMRNPYYVQSRQYLGERELQIGG